MKTREPFRRRGRSIAAIIGWLLAGLLVVCVSSCKLLGERAALELDFSEGEPRADLSVTARFIRDTDDAPGFFRSHLPDSGIVPVFVGLRNNGNRTLVIHSANGMGLDSGFDGFTLIVDGTSYPPMHPRDVAERLLGVKRARRYERPSTFGMFMGTIVPPVGGVFIFREMDVGRFYRPLFKRSLYPALPSGACRPIELAGGEVRSGYLYFDVGGDAASDAVAGGDFPRSSVSVNVPFEGRGCELLIQPCVPSAAGDTIAGFDFQFAGKSLVALRRSAERELELVSASVSDDPREPLGPFAALASISSKSATIGDAAVRGDSAAVGINFTSKSKVILATLGESPRSLGEEYFARGIDGVLFSEAGVLVRTEDGYCRAFSADRARRGAYVRLGAEVTDAVVVGGRLAAFQRTRGLALFGASLGNVFEPVGGRRLDEGRREVVGFLDDKLVVLNRGSATAGDTIALFMTEGMSEIRRMALPAHAARAVCGDSALLLQLEDGTLLKLVPAPLARLSIAAAAYLPFIARTLACVDWGFVAVGSGGIVAAGPFDRYEPGSRGMLEIRAPIR